MDIKNSPLFFESLPLLRHNQKHTIMAGHFPLSKFDEPKIFEIVNKLRHSVILQGRFVKDFEKFKVTDKDNSYEVMKLSKKYVENPKKEKVFLIGNFSLTSITDEHPSITQDISLEVHFKETLSKIEIINIFWVA